MRDYIFHEGEIPSGYRTNFDVSVFNQQAHLRLQAHEGWVSFWILSPASHTVDALVHFHIRERSAKSPLRSPFGSVEASEKLSPELLFNFIRFIETSLKDKGIGEIIIKNSPDVYMTEPASLVTVMLINSGYSVAQAELTSVLKITGVPFEQLLHPRKRRKLRQQETEPFVFRRVDVSGLKTVYDFIVSCREEKNFRLSMTLPDLEMTIRTFPSRFLIFGLYRNDQLVAASIAIKVNSRILYHFISDYVRRIENGRPGLVLMDNLYRFCQDDNIGIIDLGTSVLNGIPNFNLLNYKTELGAITSNKLTLHKHLS